MAGLFGMLGTTANALEAQRYGLDVVGQNIANVSTPGYTRRVVDFAAVPPPTPLSAGGGVEVQATRSLRDRLLDQRFWREAPAEHHREALANALSLVETAIGAPGAGIDRRLGRVFDAFAALADAPTSAAARQQVLAEAQGLAGEFRSVSARLEEAARDADQRLRGYVQDVNALSARIAALNRQIGNASGPAVAHLVDEQRVAVGQLAELVDIQAIERQSGGLDVVLSNGRPLALADIPYPLDVASVGPSGYADITSGGSSVTAGITGGRIGGLLELRDRTVPAYMARLDELAHGVATQINSLHATGFDLAGNAGGVFFEPPAAVAGAARTMALDATLAGDPSLIAAAGTPAPGDNQVARSLAALRDARLMAGGSATFGDAWGQLVYAVGADASAAQAAFRAQQSVVRQVEALRENAAGISIDQEAAMMLRFQRAYEANARFFSVVDQSLTVLLNLGRA